MCEELDIVKKL